MQRQRLPESASRISSSVGSGDALEQIRRGDDETGSAEAALHRSRLDEGLLNGMKQVAVGQALDGRHVVAVGLHGQDEAGTDEHPVEQHRTGPALALLAGVLRPGITELLAQGEQQRLALPAIGLGLVPLTRREILTPRASSPARGS